MTDVAGVVWRQVPIRDASSVDGVFCTILMSLQCRQWTDSAA